MEPWTEPLRRAQRDIALVPLASRLTTPRAWRAFTELHVFAVWDFMSLLKRLQHEVAGVQTPWLPPADPALARFVNEVVLAEESDEDGAGNYTDHFSLYRAAMLRIGADVAGIDAFLAQLRGNHPWREALTRAAVPAPAAQFVGHTLQLVESGSAHEVAAAFFYGREALLPGLFAELLKGLTAAEPAFETLRYYFARHIELDGNEHGPLAEHLLTKLCGDDPQRREQAERAAAASLQARRQLWQAIERAVA